MLRHKKTTRGLILKARSTSEQCYFTDNQQIHFAIVVSAFKFADLISGLSKSQTRDEGRCNFPNR